MSSEPPISPRRAELMAALDRAMQDASSLGVLLSEQVSEQLDLHPSDFEALGFLISEGPIPAGRLSEVTGLTSGAITRMIDRLERAGYVRREPDPHDRRRVIVQVIPERIQEPMALMEPLRLAVQELYALYPDEELEMVLGFLRKAFEISVRHIEWLNARASKGASS